MLGHTLELASEGLAPLLSIRASTKEKSDVKGVGAKNTRPLDLNTNNPRIKTVRDFGKDDKIALPSVKTSIQAVTLQMAAEQAFGPVTLLVNSAGLNMSGIFIKDMDLVQFDRVIRADLYATFLTCRRFLPGLDAPGGQGRVVHISSSNDRPPRPRAM